MDRRILDLWVGIFVVAGVAALFRARLQGEQRRLVQQAGSYRVTAEFDTSAG